jgi:hypothetical protein
MQTQSISASPQFIIRPEIGPAVMRMLDQDRMPDDWTLGPERDRVIDSLLTAIKAGDPIDLEAPRSSEAAEHDGGTPTVGGYLLGLVRDRFLTGALGDWDQFIAIGALAVDIEAASQA